MHFRSREMRRLRPDRVGSRIPSQVGVQRSRAKRWSRNRPLVLYENKTSTDWWRAQEALRKTRNEMVWWNSKERGVRLGGDTSLGLSVSCTKCGRVARIRLDVALRLWGERSFARDIARDLRCSKCGARQACVHVISDSRPPHAIADDPSGGFDQGPPYPIVDPPLSEAVKAAKKRGWL